MQDQSEDQSEDQPERPAEPKIEGQDWTRYYSEPERGTAAVAASRNDDILDLTGAAHQEFVGTPSAEASPLDDQDADDRSLRELFWGED